MLKQMVHTKNILGTDIDGSRHALEHAEGFALALGTVLKCSQKKSEAVLLTPLNAGKEIRALRPGSILLDPRTFEDLSSF